MIRGDTEHWNLSKEYEALLRAGKFGKADHILKELSKVEEKELKK